VRRLGDAEGWAALACAAFVLLARVTPAGRFQLPWLWMAVWAMGTGFGIGGIRFGGRAGRSAGIAAVVVLGVVLLALAISALWRASVPNQPLQQTGAALGSRAVSCLLRGPGC